jgi:hypothetical protein
MNKPLFRLGLAASLLGLCLLSYLLAFAQTGPEWEVPIAVMTQLSLIPRVTFGLGAIALFIYLFGKIYKNTPHNLRAGYLILSIVCLTLSLLLPILHPEQWPGSLLSTLAMIQVLPVWVGCVMTYWRMSQKVMSNE